jgi:hypothetical protein
MPPDDLKLVIATELYTYRVVCGCFEGDDDVYWYLQIR